MAPQPHEVGTPDSVSTLQDIIKPTGELIPHLEQWVQTAGQKLNGTPILLGFILDGDCIHPIVEIGVPSRRTIFALGGEQCSDLFLITRIIKQGRGASFLVDWGGTTNERIYRVTKDGFTPIADNRLGLLQGDGSGKIPTNGVVLFSESTTKEGLNKKLLRLFPFTDKKTNACTRYGAVCRNQQVYSKHKSFRGNLKQSGLFEIVIFLRLQGECNKVKIESQLKKLRFSTLTWCV